MPSNQDFCFNLNNSYPENEQRVQVPKKLKHKFIKELNHKLNYQSKSFSNQEHLPTNARKIDLILKKQSSHKQKTNIDQLLESLQNGMKIVKGQWKDNKRNGNFLIQYSNGSVFNGIFQNDLKIHGKMHYKFANCVYQGGFFGEKFSGFGKLSYQGGRTIEGQWDNAQILGNATITYPKKYVYYGPVDESLYKNGEGHLFFHNEYKYIGTFKRGCITGFGTYYKGEEAIKVGLWNRGELIKQIESEEISMMGPQYYINNFSKEISDLCMNKLNGTKGEQSPNEYLKELHQREYKKKRSAKH